MIQRRHLIGPYIQLFFVQRLRFDTNASQHTISSYRDCFRIFLRFGAKRLDGEPSEFALQDFNADFILEFLRYLENERGNSIRTRNNRLAAIKSFFRFVEFREPDLMHQCKQIYSIPNKKYAKKSVQYLNDIEARALVKAPDTKTWHGRRDQLLIAFGIETGLRVSEIRDVKVSDISYGVVPYVSALRKGRKNRSTPIKKSLLRKLDSWIFDNQLKNEDFLFASKTRRKLTRDAIAKRIKKHYITATKDIGVSKSKNVTPHTLRHTTAMRFFQSGAEQPIVALWLGHENTASTDEYTHADLSLKNRAMERTSQIISTEEDQKFVEDDKLLMFLENLSS